MDAHVFVTPAQAKAIEYLIAVSYLVLFVPFWRYLDGGAATQEATAPTRGALPARDGWFAVPEGIAFHPGHAWLRGEAGRLATVGADDFAFKLVAPSRVFVPPPGREVRQGEPAMIFGSDGHEVAVLSPVTGTVVEVNEEALRAPATAALDPYGRGWLMKVRAPRLASEAKQLLTGAVARKWMEAVTDALRLQAGHPVPALEDGGVPVYGLARAVAPERWAAVAREFLLS